MKDLLACLIAGVFTIPLSILIIRICAKKQDKKDHEGWIYNCRQCLVRITHIFRSDCQSIAEKAFVQYTTIIQNGNYKHMPDYMTYSFLSEYQKSLKALEVDYIENVTAKAKEMLRSYKFDSLPNYLVEEYTKEISDIRYAFSDFGHLMQRQISEAKENK